MKFEEEKVCLRCGKKLGEGFRRQKEVKVDGDSYCANCANLIRTERNKSSCYSSISILNKPRFMGLRRINERTVVDDNKHIIYIAPIAKDRLNEDLDFISILFNDILGYELIENGESISGGDIGNAIAGGLLFGATGAIVGAVATGRDIMCSQLQVKLTLKDGSTKYIEYINTSTPKNSTNYEVQYKYAQDLVSALQSIIDKNTSSNASVSNSVNPTALDVDVIDQIRKFKALYDDGIITKEEFDIKKKQLLNL